MLGPTNDDKVCNRPISLEKEKKWLQDQMKLIDGDELAEP